MAGLLDVLDDPQQLGLLSLGLRLMSTPGRRGEAFGQAGLGAVNDMQSFRQQQEAKKRAEMQAQMFQLQLENAKRQAAGEKALQDYSTTALQSPDVDMGDTVPGPRREAAGFDLGAALRSGVPLQSALALAEQFKKTTPQPIKLGEGDQLLDPTTYRPVASNPKPQAPEKEPEEVRVLKMIYGEGTPEYLAALRRLGDKKTTHQPGVSVSYGAPVAGVDAQGNPVFFQPDKGGGAPAIVPNVKPAPQNRDTKLPAELQRMQIAGDTMEKLLGDYESMLKKFNPRDPAAQANPVFRADLQSLKRNLELQFKELQALGALAGPDIEIMREALSDPTSFAGAYYGRDGLLAQIKRARDLVRLRKESVLSSQGQGAKPNAPKEIDFNSLPRGQ